MNTTGKIKSGIIFIFVIFLLLWELKNFGGGAYFNEYVPVVAFAIILVAVGSAVTYLLRRRCR